METSAKNNNNVEKLFEYFTYKLIKYYEKNQDKYIGDGSDDLDSFNKFTDLNIDIKGKKPCSC